MVNCDVKTGCHYGVISFHSVSPEALDDIYSEGENLTYQAAVEEAKASLKSCLGEWFSDYLSRLDVATDSAWDAISDDWNDQYQGEDEQYLYVANGYRITNSPSLCCLFVELSPYYTYARECSPCAPNAGDLDNPDGSLKTYCLGPEWFERNHPPYAIYAVEGDVLIHPMGEDQIEPE